MKKSQQAQYNIKKHSGIAISLSALGLALLILVAINPLYLVITDSPFKDYIFLERVVPEGMAINPVSFGRELAGLLIFLPSIMGVIAVLICLICWSIFEGYRSGEIFTISSARKIKKLGWVLIFVPVIDFVGRAAAASVLTSFQNIEELRLSALTTWFGLLAVIVGLLLIAIGSILHNAAILNDDNKSFV